MKKAHCYVHLAYPLAGTGSPGCHLVSITSASEVFQKKNEKAFSDIPGIYIVVDVS